MGRSETRLRLKQRSFFFHFLYYTNGVDTWELQKVKNNYKIKNNPNTAFLVGWATFHQPNTVPENNVNIEKNLY